ncbi:excalibur calcium-binding domain-containing protein [Metabacillus halosaccharovorans]|uniref:excalibur calcium-binding domain-containing protein n=1 Tax=Metabacillus halosaccharovorans TaxID=930124 RepID=UPI002041F347|nr:excalibur calcium-binding domain-containing protein [Metabacillus halosaccharovorans]MCM3441423.1 excalibur calcium-binding domain-containing protein [Metabacillus halosaccharovorans]
METTWIGEKPTLGQKNLYRKYSSLLSSSPILKSEKILKIIEAECDKSSGRELDGVIILTTENFYFLSKKEVITYPYTMINDISVKRDDKDKNEYKLTLRIGRSNRYFDDIKKTDDADELFEILEATIINPNQKVLTTVTHNFDTFLHAEKLEKLKEDNVKITTFLMKRDNMGLSKNGIRLLKEKHPEALYVGEGFFQNKEKKKQGNFIVVDKTIWLYEYDDKKREARKIIIWPFTFLSGAIIDHYAIKSELSTPEGDKLVLNSGGKKFTETLDILKIEYSVKTRKWHQKILGFRTGKMWKKTIASLTYVFALLVLLIAIFSEDPEPVPATTSEVISDAVSEENQKAETNPTEEELKKQEEEEAKQLAVEEEKKKQEAEAQRLAEEKKKQEEAARLAAEQERIRKEEEAKAIAAEEERKKQEVAAQAQAEAEAQQQASNVYYKNCDAVRAAGADPIRKGEPGYSTKLDRDGDGIACDR